MALALYRKYRPRTFAEVIGQEHVTEPLSQALRSGRLHHAYLFSGPRGCGKTSSARILARSLNCEQGPTPEPCGVCASCRSLANDGAGSIDVIEIDAASHGGVDDARELREKAFFAPASSRYKIYVIDEAHMVSSAGFNALLKLVEEPPEYVKFIFATTEPEKVLGTIRSRTHHYPFRLIPPAVLRPYLQQLTDAEGIAVEPAVFPLVVRAGGGSARDTLSVLDQLIAGAGPDGVSYSRAVSLLGVTDVTLIDEMCDAIAAGDGAAAYSTIDRVAEAGHDPRRFASDLLERFRDLIVLQQVPDAVAKGLIDGPADQLEAMGSQAARLGQATLSRCADIVHNGLVEMRGTTAPRLLLELITARMLLPGADDSTGALLQRLERMEQRLSSVRGDGAALALGAPAGAVGGASGGSAGGSVGGSADGSVSGVAVGGPMSGPGGGSGGGSLGGGADAERDGSGGGAPVVGGGLSAARAAAKAAAARRSTAAGGRGAPAGGGAVAPGAPAAAPPGVSAPAAASAPPSAAASAPPAASASVAGSAASAPSADVPASASGTAASASASAAAAPAVSAASGVASPGSAAAAVPVAAVPVASGPPAGADPDWNQVADGAAEHYDEEPPWDDYETVEPAAMTASGPEAAVPGLRADAASAVRQAPAEVAARAGRVEAAASTGDAGSARGGEPADVPAPARRSEPAEMPAPARGSDPADVPASVRRSEPAEMPASARRSEPGDVSASARRSEPAGVLPDAPEEPGAAAVEAVAAGPGQPTAEEIRQAWHDVLEEVKKQPRGRILQAAAKDAVVRAVEGQTVVLTASAGIQPRIAQGAALIANALYEVLGGQWEVRCEVAGEGGAVQYGRPQGGPQRGARQPSRNEGARPAPATQRSAPPSGQPASAAREPQNRRREAAAPASSDDDWPEPVKPGGLTAAPPPPVADDDEWPEVTPIGSQAPSSRPASHDDIPGRADGPAPASGAVSGQAAAAGPALAGQGVAHAGVAAAGQGVAHAGVAAAGGSGFGGAGGVAAVDAAPARVEEPVRGGPDPAGSGDAEWPQVTSTSGPAGIISPDASTGAVSPGELVRDAVPSADSVSEPGAATPQPAGSSGEYAAPAQGGSAGGGLSAARAAAAAAAAARSAGASAPAADNGGANGAGGGPGAAAAARASRNAASGGLAAARAAAAGARNPGARQAPAKQAWSDGSPTEEAPYDPEYDGPPTGGAARSFEGFDPGDEPLDEVLDEKTARESGEQQALRLLQEALGAEKIGETG
ncbi:hypothetical protein Ade02nite_39110 [Paractinoplanes deccanensis]|uniref:DNA-directed DNA polymerase n=1 Tax=Paractinoplanes deccanensis TaxID=113561 RepID=A0ABQ3Y5W6_9ACTN|nr:DNA polymerase III subunit gamma and tau [Actinoplanes deccanensis]GID75270.1 hypothetical protein Ade02nite_39110 [Actinoplanes deccanensis]